MTKPLQNRDTRDFIIIQPPDMPHPVGMDYVDQLDGLLVFQGETLAPFRSRVGLEFKTSPPDWTSLEGSSIFSDLDSLNPLLRLNTTKNRLATIAILAHFAKGHLFSKAKK